MSAAAFKSSSARSPAAAVFVGRRRAWLTRLATPGGGATMLLDPFLYDFVAEHQHALREAAERARPKASAGRAGGGCRSVCPRRWSRAGALGRIATTGLPSAARVPARDRPRVSRTRRVTAPLGARARVALIAVAALLMLDVGRSIYARLGHASPTELWQPAAELYADLSWPPGSDVPEAAPPERRLYVR
jgi:hypothetical protein